MASEGTTKRFPLHRGDQEVNPKPSFPTVEEETLAYWDADDTFKKSVENRAAGDKGSNEFVF